jgi:hypothetical protein
MTDNIKYDETSPEADGDWRVDHDLCVACGAPPVQAPSLMGFGDKFAGARAGNIQCYFKKQPSGSTEMERAYAAAATSCCNAIRYHGNDADIRRRIPEFVGPAPRPLWLSAGRGAIPRHWLWFSIVGMLLVGLWLALL